MGSIFQKSPFNYQYYVGQAGVVDYDVTPIQVSANNPLQDLIIPVGTLVQLGQKLIVNGVGITSGIAAVKQFLLQVNGTTVFDSGGLTFTAGRAWHIYSLMMRDTDNELLITSHIMTNIPPSGGGAIPTFVASFRQLTPVNFNQAITLQFVGAPSGGDTITQLGSWVDVI